MGEITESKISEKKLRACTNDLEKYYSKIMKKYDQHNTLEFSVIMEVVGQCLENFLCKIKLYQGLLVSFIQHNALTLNYLSAPTETHLQKKNNHAREDSMDETSKEKGFMSLLMGMIRGARHSLPTDEKPKMTSIHDFEIIKPISRGAFG